MSKCASVSDGHHLSLGHICISESPCSLSKKKARQTSCATVLGISSNGPRTCVPQPDANSQQLKEISQALTRSEIDEQDAKYTMKWVRCLSRRSVSDVCPFWQRSEMFPSLKSNSVFDASELKNSSCGLCCMKNRVMIVCILMLIRCSSQLSQEHAWVVFKINK